MTPAEREAMAKILRGEESADLNAEVLAAGDDQARRQAYARTLMGYGLGPTTDSTRAGVPNAEARSYEPTPGENASFALRKSVGEQPLVPGAIAGVQHHVDPMVRALLDYGPEPAKAYAGQFGKATDAVAGAMADPSLSNIGNAGVQTGAAAMSPALMLGGAAVGFGDAAARDMGFSAVSPAEAQQRRKGAPPPAPAVPDLAGLPPDMQASYKDVKRKLESTDWMPRETRRSLSEQMKEFTRIAGEAASRQGGLDEEKKRAEQQEYERRVQQAEILRDKEMGRDKRFSDTATGQFYEKSGGLAPVIAAMGLGGLGRVAHGPAGGKALSYAEGVLGAGLGLNAKDLYEGFATQTENPRRKALEEYGLELPAGHPRKQESMDAAASLPAVNPTQTAALDKLRDPTTLGIRGGLMLLEGTAGPMGAGLVNAPGRIGRDIAEKGMFGSKDRAKREAEAAILRGRHPPSPGTPVGSSPLPAGGVPPASGTAAPQIPPPPPSPPPPGLLPSQAGNVQRRERGAAQQDSSRMPSYETSVHTPISREVMADYLRRGSVPDTIRVRTDIQAAMDAAGVARPAAPELSRRVNATHPVAKLVEGADESTQGRFLTEILGTGRYLSVPATAATGGAAMDEEQRRAFAQVLRGF